MHARDILGRPVVTVRPETPLTEAIEQLTERGCAVLPVVGDRDQVVGKLSESVVQPRTGIAYRMLSAGLRSIRSRRTYTGS